MTVLKLTLVFEDCLTPVLVPLGKVLSIWEFQGRTMVSTTGNLWNRGTDFASATLMVVEPLAVIEDMLKKADVTVARAEQV